MSLFGTTVAALAVITILWYYRKSIAALRGSKKTGETFPCDACPGCAGRRPGIDCSDCDRNLYGIVNLNNNQDSVCQAPDP